MDCSGGRRGLSARCFLERTGQPQNNLSDLSISMFGRFTNTPSALNEYCLDKEFITASFLDNVRSYHTERS